MTDSHVKVNAIATNITYEADGVQTIFPYPFPVLRATDVEVYVNGAIVTEGFTVTGARQDNGGDVTFTEAPEDGAQVTLKRNMAVERLSDYQIGGEIRATVINDDFDSIVMMLQETDAEISQALKIPITDYSGENLNLPPPEAGKVIAVWNDDATALEIGPSAADIKSAQTNSESAIDAANNAAASAEASAQQAEAAEQSANEAAASAEAAANAVDGGVKVSDDDTTPSHLEEKIAAGAGVTLSTQNEGENESLIIGVDTGTGANQIVQLDSSGNLPAIDGSNLTGISSVNLINTTFVTNNTRTSVPAIDVYLLWSIPFVKLQQNSKILVIMHIVGQGFSDTNMNINLRIDEGTKQRTAGYSATETDSYSSVILSGQNIFSGIDAGNRLLNIDYTSSSNTNSRPFLIWNPNSSDDARLTQRESSVIIMEVL